MDDPATNGAPEDQAAFKDSVGTLADEPAREHNGPALAADASVPAPAARFFALALDLLVTAGADGYIKHVNPAWERLLGWTPEELRSRPWVEFIHPDDQERKLAEAEGLASGGTETRNFELRFRAKDGAHHWLLFSAQADPGSGLLYAIAKDITDRKQSEDALRDAEARFRSAFENAAIGMSMTSMEGQFMRVNPALCEITGYPEKELVGMRVRDITHPDHIEADLTAMQRMRSGEASSYRTEKRYVRPDETHVWVSLSTSVVPGADGTPLYFLSQMEDISERKRVAAELQEALLSFESVAQSVNDAVVSADEDGRIVFWNESARAMFGYEADEVLGQPLTVLMPERHREAHTAGIQRLRDGGEPRLLGGTVCLDGRRKDGLEFPLELSLGDWRTGDRRQFTGIVRDITERRRAERYLAAQYAVARVLAGNPALENASAELLAGVGESMGWKAGGLWLIDRDAEALRCEAFWHAPDEDVAVFEQATRELTLQRGVGLPGRVWQRGEPVWIRDASHEPNFPRADAAQAAGLHSAIGLPIVSGREVVGALDFFSPQIQQPDQALLDMMGTIGSQLGEFFERKRAERALAKTATELKRRAAELERSNADLEQFAYVASHDLSEPLRMVSGFVQLLSERYRGQLDRSADEFIDFTVEGVQRMQGLIEDLLTFSRVGRGDAARTPVECDAIVRRTLDAFAEQVEQTGADVEMDDLPTVHGHEVEIGQLFQNLLSNALKFHGDEPPRVRVTAEPEGDMWLFAVVDNGIGIESRHAERIFKMFQRLHPRDAYAGTGIGLPICKKVVEGHGGRIWLEPAASGGSAFKFTLPGAEEVGS